MCKLLLYIVIMVMMHDLLNKLRFSELEIIENLTISE